MHEQVIAKKYAVALFETAKQTGEVDRIAGDLESLRESMGYDEPVDDSLRHFLEAPQFTDESKKRILERILRGEVSETLLRFAFLLLEKKRIEYWRLIADEYARLIDAWRGIIRARVITAAPIEKARAEELAANLAKKTGKQITLVPEIDSDIIGGMIVILEDKIIDGSIRFRLQSLKDELLAAKVG